MSKELSTSIGDQRPMNVKQVMEYLQIKRTTLYRYMQKGLPYVRMGKELRFWKHKVDEWLNERGE